jgi:hypothetical protein
MQDPEVEGLGKGPQKEPSHGGTNTYRRLGEQRGSPPEDRGTSAKRPAKRCRNAMQRGPQSLFSSWGCNVSKPI